MIESHLLPTPRVNAIQYERALKLWQNSPLREWFPGAVWEIVQLGPHTNSVIVRDTKDESESSTYLQLWAFRENAVVVYWVLPASNTALGRPTWDRREVRSLAELSELLELQAKLRAYARGE